MISLSYFLKIFFKRIIKVFIDRQIYFWSYLSIKFDNRKKDVIKT